MAVPPERAQARGRAPAPAANPGGPPFRSQRPQLDSVLLSSKPPQQRREDALKRLQTFCKNRTPPKNGAILSPKMDIAKDDEEEQDSDDESDDEEEQDSDDESSWEEVEDEEGEKEGRKAASASASTRDGKAPLAAILNKICKVCKQSGHDAGFKGATCIECAMKPFLLHKTPVISIQETTDVDALEITPTVEEHVIKEVHSNKKASLDHISSADRVLDEDSEESSWDDESSWEEEEEDEEEREAEVASDISKEGKTLLNVSMRNGRETGFQGANGIDCPRKPSLLHNAPVISIQPTDVDDALEIAPVEEVEHVVEEEHSNTKASLDHISSETIQVTSDSILSETTDRVITEQTPVVSPVELTSDYQRNTQECTPTKLCMSKSVRWASPILMEHQATERSLVEGVQIREDSAVVDQTTFAVVNALEIIGDQARWSSLLPSVKTSESGVNSPSLQVAHHGLRQIALRGILNTITSVTPSEMDAVMPHVATLAGLFGADNYDWTTTRSALVNIIDCQQAKGILSMQVQNIQADVPDLGQIKSHEDSLKQVRSKLEDGKNAAQRLQLERQLIETNMEELRRRLTAMDPLENVCQAYIELMTEEERRMASVVEAETETHRTFEARLRSVEAQLCSLQVDFECKVAELSALFQ